MRNQQDRTLHPTDEMTGDAKAPRHHRQLWQRDHEQARSRRELVDDPDRVAAPDPPPHVHPLDRSFLTQPSGRNPGVFHRLDAGHERGRDD